MPETTVIIRNKTTKAEGRVTLTKWRQIRNSKYFAGVFEVVSKVKVPPEVVALLKAQEATRNNF